MSTHNKKEEKLSSCCNQPVKEFITGYACTKCREYCTIAPAIPEKKCECDKTGKWNNQCYKHLFDCSQPPAEKKCKKYPTKCACGITDISHTPYCQVSVKTEDWESILTEMENGTNEDVFTLKEKADVIRKAIAQARQDTYRGIMEWVEGQRVFWYYHRGNCNVCDYTEHCGETHSCETRNQALSDVLAYLSSLKGE